VGASRNRAAGSRRAAGEVATVCPPVVAVTELHKEYRLGSNVVRALRGVTLNVMRGEFVAIMGPSGSGKSTFMNLIGCLDRPTMGSYRLDGVEVTGMDPNTLADFRNRKLGFIFQGYNLLPRMDALGNVMLPMIYAGVPARVRLERALAALEAVGLSQRADHRPSEMSGGQQQRVAIARALVNSPALVLADEPTANLDGENAEILMHMMRDLRNRHGMTFIFSTHDPRVVAHAVRVVTLVDGRVARDEVTPGEAPHEIIPGIGKAPATASA
jgi:putative ABC transport system ATP-binding protein